MFILSLAGCSLAAGWTVWKSGGNRTAAAGLRKVSRSSHALGTTVRITAYHADRRVATEALDAAFERLDAVENVMSLYRPDSQICRLNREGVLNDADPALLEVLDTANRLSARTEGAFDITVQPLYEVYAAHAKAGSIPDGKALRDACSKVGWRRVRVAAPEVRLDGGGTRITLNGIAQGYAADAVGEVLARSGITHAFIDTGEIGTIGRPVNRDHWNVGIKHPRRESGFLGVARLEGRCLATSGDYESRFDEAFRHHHILHPRTGRSPSELSSVSVAAKTAMEADALSTAVFLLGLKEGWKFIEATPGVDALFVDKAGRITPTSGFPRIG